MRVQQYIQEHALLKPDDTIIVGVSGGADSCVLIHMLLSLNYQCIIAHCNFHLRGEESMRDEIFVTDLAAKYNCKLHKVDFDTTGYATGNNISIEMAARELRYNWFEKIRQHENAACIAVAHHSDDAVETILMNLTRGTGINGLTGIKPRNGFIIRPLLCMSRKDVMLYVKYHKLSYVTDSTNTDTCYIRNRFREKIIPALEEINPSFSSGLLQTADRLNDVACVYNTYINDIKKQLVTIQNDTIYISIQALQKEQIKKSILFEIAKEYGFNTAQCNDIIKNITGNSGQQYFSPSHRLIKDREFLIIDKITNKDDEEYKIAQKEQTIDTPVSLTFEVIEKDENTVIDHSPSVAYLDYEKITFPLTLRHWKKGDSFYPLGMKNKKKLSDYFTDKKFSLDKKEQTWLLLSDNKIIWLVNERIDDRFKITPSTKIILKIIC